MAPSFDSLRLRNQLQIDARLTADHRRMAQQMALEVIRAAGPDGLIPADTRTREALRLAIWERVLKPYYVGTGTEPLIGAEAQSPYAKLLVEGIAIATRIQAERQAALVRRVVRDPEVVAWLTGPRPVGILTVPTSALPPGPLAGIAFNPTRDVLGGLVDSDGNIDMARAKAALVRPRGFHDPYYRWLDANGYRLSDRIWRTSIEVRARIDALMSYHIASGTSAVDIAKLLEPFLTPAGAKARTLKPYPAPYGTEGSFSARRLARTEITVASHRATVDAAIVNPFVNGIQWRLSASHPKIDICDDLARGGPNGDGIYPLDQVPAVPHPFCVTPGQLVTTLRGPVPIEDVRRGDMVLTHKGRYRRVLAAWATPHEGQVYAFETEWGSFELTGNHPVLTRRGWVNAEAVQLGEQVLYAGGGVRLDADLVEAKDVPALPLQPGIAPQVLEGLDGVPVSIALNSDLDGNEGDVNEVTTHLVFACVGYAEYIELGAHRQFERVGVGKALLFGALQHGHQAGVISPLGAADFASDFRSLGWVRITGQVKSAHGFAHGETGSDTARAVVFFPTGGNGIAHRAHGDIVQGEQVAQDAIGDAVLLIDLHTGQPLLDVDVNEQGADGNAVLSFKALGVHGRTDSGISAFPGAKAPSLECIGSFDGESFLASLTDKRDPAGEVVHDNLLSLSPDDSVGRESGNPLVSEVANPTQALTNYTPIRAIRQRHYTGPVYNMEVADDHSYTVNGAACHNCLCSQLPVPMGSTADLVASLRADIQAARANLIDAASGGNAARAEALRGTLNPTFLTRALLGGTLEESIMGVVRVAQEQ